MCHCKILKKQIFSKDYVDVPVVDVGIQNLSPTTIVNLSELIKLQYFKLHSVCFEADSKILERFSEMLFIWNSITFSTAKTTKHISHKSLKFRLVY